MRQIVTICCIKWGKKYGPEYVNALFNMVDRNIHFTAWRFVCFTEDSLGIDERIRVVPLLCSYPGWWQKIGLFQETLPNVPAEKILFLDLDIVITGELDTILNLDADFAICRDWPPEMNSRDLSCNSSVFLLRVGSRPQVWNHFHPEVMNMRQFPTDQEWITEKIPGASMFPYDWTPSYKLRKLQDAVPDGARIVLFHGTPKPHQCGGWVKDLWK